jgi:hypothetical protein
MNRTTLSLPDDVAFALKREARRRHTSVSVVARGALAERFGVGGAGPREVPFAAIGRSGDGRGARKADEMLRDVFEARDARRRDERCGRLRAMETQDLESPSSEDYARIAELVETYVNFPLGGVDASVIVLAERLGTPTVLTLDRRHFAAVRPARCESLELQPE